MMDIVEEQLRLIEVFRQKAESKRFEQAMRALDQREDEHRRREKIKLRKEEEERKLEEAIIASTAQLATFNEHLDDYDTATVHALMDNQHALDLVFKQREEMEAGAFRLPDGRMVFKTEDGQRVFDQHGAQLGPETVHPDAIPDSAPTWEAKLQNKAEADKLLRERDQLHDYQKHLDEAREAAGKDGVTAGALAKMDDDLRRAMPDAVKARLPGAAAEHDMADLRVVPASSPDLLRVPAFVPAPAGP